MIAAVVEQHLEELAFLYEQWQSAVCSPDWLREDLRDLNDRIVAHVDGVLVAGDQAIPLLDEQLTGDEPSLVFAASLLLLRLNQPAAADRVMNVLGEAAAEQLDSIRRALYHCSLDLIEERLHEAAASAPATVAAAAAEALAAHGRLRRNSARLLELLQAEDPSVRQSAWRIVALLEAGNETSSEPVSKQSQSH